MQYTKGGQVITGYELRKLYPHTTFSPDTPYELGYSDYVPPEQPVVEVVPFALSRFQTMAVLHLEGKLGTVEALISLADPMTKLAWAEAQEFRRTSPSIAAIAQTLGWTDEYLDHLFKRGATIEA